MDKIEKSIYDPPDIAGDKKPKVDLNNSKDKKKDIAEFKNNYNNFDNEKILEYQAKILIHNKSLIKRNIIKFTAIIVVAVLSTAA